MSSRKIGEMEGVMMLLNSLKGTRWNSSTEGDPQNPEDVDWRAIAEGCGMVGESNSEVDDMVWFVVRRTGLLGSLMKEEAIVRRRTEKETWLSDTEDVNWEHTLYLNVITNWKFSLTVAVVSNATQTALHWVSKEVFASPRKVRSPNNGKEITYEDTYPDIYFNIEDYESAFGEMRLQYGQSWAVEISALSPAGRVQIVKGKLAYQQIARKFQYQAGGNRVDHVEDIVVKGPGGTGNLVLAVSVAPEEEVGCDIDIQKARNRITRLARKTRQKIEGRGDRVSQATTPALQCCLPCIAASQLHVVSSILKLEKTPAEEWIRIPQSPSGSSEASLPPSSPVKTKTNTLELTEEEYQALFDAQGTDITSPRDQRDKNIWYESFFSSLLYVDAVLGCSWNGWLSKRAGKRVLGQQAYKQRMIVITPAGFLHYFADATPQAVVRGTCYLKSAKLVRRLRSSPSSSTPFVLEVHPTTPRRPQSAMDKSYHFGFPTDAELRVFIDQISRFLVVPV